VSGNRSQLSRQLESQVRRACHAFDLIEDDSGIAIALSGGKDSLTLLHLLHRIRGYGFPNFPLIAIHVSGAFTCGAGVNLPFLEGQCRQLGVPLAVREVDQKLEDLECYSCSRKRRRLIFDAAKSHGFTKVAFGHHRDDSIQTLLMNLLQKGEFAANLPKVPMYDYGVTILRPLILCDESKIRLFAQQQGFARITCQCPVGATSKRRQVEELIHQMEELFPNARENLALASRQHGLQKALLPTLRMHAEMASLTQITELQEAKIES
jgi:tRNA(Ile)-lysidine synthase TilS/MesJ